MSLGDLPANPTSIRLQVVHERLWWQIKPIDDQPERWDVSAHLWGKEDSDQPVAHVGDVSLALLDLAMEHMISLDEIKIRI